MLDQLLGRAELKEQIAALEGEIEDLERQLESAQDRRADAVREKQRAEERVNRLEDRIADLEGNIERLRDQNATSLDYRRRETLRGQRAEAVLDRLESVEAGEEEALTAYVDGDPSDTVRVAFGERATLVSRAAPCLAVVDDAGVVSATLSVPDPPEPFAEWDDGFEFERGWFRPRGRYTLALVRSDLFAMGEYQGDERVAFHGFDSDLKSQHSKGGFSQARFERIRDEQISNHLDRCREALAERSTDRLYLVGERTVLEAFDVAADATATVDATGDPETALEDAFHDFWTVQLRAI